MCQVLLYNITGNTEETIEDYDEEVSVSDDYAEDPEEAKKEYEEPVKPEDVRMSMGM